MSETSPTQVLQHADHPQQKLHRVVAQETSKVVGRQVSSTDVNPDDQSALVGIQEILGDSTHVVNSTVEEFLHGGSTSHVRTTRGSVPTALAAGKWLKRKLLRRDK